MPSKQGWCAWCDKDVDMVDGGSCPDCGMTVWPKKDPAPTPDPNILIVPLWRYVD